MPPQVLSSDRSTVLATLDAGAFFGEQALFYRQQRTATIRAADFCEILVRGEFFSGKMPLKWRGHQFFLFVYFSLVRFKGPCPPPQSCSSCPRPRRAPLFSSFCCKVLTKADLDYELLSRNFDLSRMRTIFDGLKETNGRRNAALEANLAAAAAGGRSSKLRKLIFPPLTEGKGAGLGWGGGGGRRGGVRAGIGCNGGGGSGSAGTSGSGSGDGSGSGGGIASGLRRLSQGGGGARLSFWAAAPDGFGPLGRPVSQQAWWTLAAARAVLGRRFRAG